MFLLSRFLASSSCGSCGPLCETCPRLQSHLARARKPTRVSSYRKRAPPAYSCAASFARANLRPQPDKVVTASRRWQQDKSLAKRRGVKWFDPRRAAGSARSAAINSVGTFRADCVAVLALAQLRKHSLCAKRGSCDGRWSRSRAKASLAFGRAESRTQLKPQLAGIAQLAMELCCVCVLLCCLSAT